MQVIFDKEKRLRLTISLKEEEMKELEKIAKEKDDRASRVASLVISTWLKDRK